MRAVLYNTVTGEVEGIIGGSQKQIDLGLSETQDYIETDEDPTNKIVVDGVLVPLPAEQIEAQEIELAWGALRTRRDLFLMGCDWTQIPDTPVDSAAWAIYRQQLRDLPANTTDPRNVTWPEPPS